MINHFVFKELDQRRKDFSSIDRETFVSQPLPNKGQWLAALKIYLDEQSVPLNLENTDLASAAIHSYLGLQLFDEATQLEILHREDRFVQAALEELVKKPLD